VSALAYAIDPAGLADVPDLMRLIRGLAAYERLEHLVTADESMLADALCGQGATVESLIARKSGINGEALGFALFFHTYSTFLGRRGLWLEDLFVVSEHRGSGIGRALLMRLAAIARERNCGRFEWAVLDWNTPAIDFYRQMGATLLPEWRIARVTGDALADFGRRAEPDG
jgi:GNAT superfamily N-acetyltransferase